MSKQLYPFQCVIQKVQKKKYEELHIIVVVLAEDKVLNTSFIFTYR